MINIRLLGKYALYIYPLTVKNGNMKKNMLLILIFASLVGCTNDSVTNEFNDAKTINQDGLAEKMIGVWQITRITYLYSDGSSHTANTGCPTFSTFRFSPDGTYTIEDYEGDSSDINDCNLYIVEGLWLLETDPENADNNFKGKRTTLNGENYTTDWGYGRLEVSGNSMTIISTNDNWKTTEYLKKIL